MGGGSGDQHGPDQRALRPRVGVRVRTAGGTRAPPALPPPGWAPGRRGGERTGGASGSVPTATAGGIRAAGCCRRSRGPAVRRVLGRGSAATARPRSDPDRRLFEHQRRRPRPAGRAGSAGAGGGAAGRRGRPQCGQRRRLAGGGRRGRGRPAMAAGRCGAARALARRTRAGGLAGAAGRGRGRSRRRRAHRGWPGTGSSRDGRLSRREQTSCGRHRTGCSRSSSW